jgi:hypothetical protein
MASPGRSKRRGRAVACLLRTSRRRAETVPSACLQRLRPAGTRAPSGRAVICLPGVPAIAVRSANALILLCNSIGEWCNGSTTDSDSVCLGSNPGSPAKSSYDEIRRSEADRHPAVVWLPQLFRAAGASVRRTRSSRRQTPTGCNSRPRAGASHHIGHQPRARQLCPLPRQRGCLHRLMI